MQAKIKKLLKQRKAIMLAHNYQPPEIQDLADELFNRRQMTLTLLGPMDADKKEFEEILYD